MVAWKMDLDVFGDPNWSHYVDGKYFELRIAPIDNGYGLVLLTADSEYSEHPRRKVLKKGLSRDDIIKFAEDYVKKH